MDPDANLKEQLELAQEIQDRLDGDELEAEEYSKWQLGVDASRLADRVQALDQWIDNGGFLPKCWQPK